MVQLYTPMFHVVVGSSDLQTALKRATPLLPVLADRQLEYSVATVCEKYMFNHDNKFGILRMQ